jgi:hypothetical protein
MADSREPSATAWSSPAAAAGSGDVESPVLSCSPSPQALVPSPSPQLPFSLSPCLASRSSVLLLSRSPAPPLCIPPPPPRHDNKVMSEADYHLSCMLNC